MTLSLLSACRQPDSRYMPGEYPQTRADSTVIDDYFGHPVPDPYRWLENDTSAETGAWVEAQRQLTADYFRHIPFRDRLKQRLTELQNYERVSAPYKNGGRYFFSKNDGLQNQNVIYVQDSLDAEPRVFLDPNRLSDDGTVAYAGMSVSKNGKYAAYVIHRNGSDWSEIYVMDVATGQLLDDHIEWAKFTDAAWCGNGFYYAAYNAPDAHAYSGKNENHKIYYHTVGTGQEADELVYENPARPYYFHSVQLSEDERYMFLLESGQGAGHTLSIKDLQNPADRKFRLIADNMDFFYYPIDIIDGTLYIYTNYNAPKGRVCRVPVRTPEIDKWEDLIPESEQVISAVNLAAGHIIVTYSQDASDRAFVYTMQGERKQEIQFPTFGATGFSCDYKERDIFYTFTSFTFPASVYRYDLESNESVPYIVPEVDFIPEEYVTEQLFVTSKDGTRVPLFLTYKKSLKRDGTNPTLLYGYGGFNISLTPGFSPSRIAFLEKGGIYAQANLRGGNEYGEEWHLAGTKMNKQNVFDDFIAAAEHLIANKYTSPDYLAIEGGSNGGLLVGACVNQRPDLFRVAIPSVGVMDMLRYHKFTIGWNWASDYGTSEDSEEMFRYLKNYSPLHTIKSGAAIHYPAVLVTTADHDDRVVPAHSFKYVATLQAARTGSEPKLIRIDSKAGHGAGKPISKRLEEQADVYSFILYNMNLDY